MPERKFGTMDVRRGKILLVEDDPNDVMFVHMAFERAQLGHALTMVSDGDQAIEYLRGQGPYADREKFPVPSMILLDLRLPTVSGFEVLKWVRGQEEYKRLPITVFTGSDYQKHLDRAYELGANSVILKPFRLEDFFGAVSMVTDFWLATCQLPEPRGMQRPGDCGPGRPGG